jgi:hypothetical protein
MDQIENGLARKQFGMKNGHIEKYTSHTLIEDGYFSFIFQLLTLAQVCWQQTEAGGWEKKAEAGG